MAAITLTTQATTNILSTTATAHGTVTDLGGLTMVERGILWSPDPFPYTIHTDVPDVELGTGSFDVNLTGLPQTTTLNIVAYAVDDQDTRFYGDADVIITLQGPAVQTLPVYTIGKTTAVLRGRINNDHGHAVSTVRFYYDTSSDPINNGTYIDVIPTGNEFESIITGLEPGTLMYVVATAVNISGFGFGSVLHFTTEVATIPVVETLSALSNIFTTVMSGGSVIDDGSDDLTVTGIAWSLSPTPTTGDNVVGNSGDNYLPFNLSFTTTPNTVYYIRAFATNSTGTAYGNEVSIETSGTDMLPQIFESTSKVEVIPFTTVVPFDKQLTIAQTQVTSAITIEPDIENAIPGAKALYRLIGDGIATPLFSSLFTIDGESATYDATANVVNLVEFLFDGFDYWVLIKNQTGLPA